MIKRNIYIYSPAEIRAIREALRMTRYEFAELFFLEAETIKNWEIGRRNPSGPAMLILQMLDEEIREKKAAAEDDKKKGRAVFNITMKFNGGN